MPPGTAFDLFRGTAAGQRDEVGTHCSMSSQGLQNRRLDMTKGFWELRQQNVLSWNASQVERYPTALDRTIKFGKKSHAEVQCCVTSSGNLCGRKQPAVLQTVVLPVCS